MLRDEKMEKIVGKATVREALYVPVEQGSVFIYKVKSDGVKLFFKDFYVATFDNTQDEVPWGVGHTPVEALKTAEREWERINDKYDYDEEEYRNPFREALENLQQMVVGETTSEVTVKEVLNESDVFVYKIENDDDNLYFGDFYVVTFDGVRGEVAWGVGGSPKTGLENAEREWDRKMRGYVNPFKEALEKLKESNNILRNY